MLPAAPATSPLSKAFAAALKRLNTRAPSLITFIDPRTAQPAEHAAGVAAPDWLVVDAAVPPTSSSIRWDAHTG
jgi:hypothetical protein